MPRRKKTRTTSIRPGTRPDFDHPSRGVRKLRQVKRDVANEAARIMATEGQRNYMAAKRKAAERIGVNARLALPSNKEVEDALRAYQGLYGGERLVRRLGYLRDVAVQAMRILHHFSPRLVGPVLDGTADEHSRVSLHLFSDPRDEVVIYLQERGVPFRQEQRKIRWHNGDYRPLQLLVADFEDAVVELALFNRIDLRQAPPSPVDGKPQRRASLSEVEGLLAAPTAA